MPNLIQLRKQIDRLDDRIVDARHGVPDLIRSDSGIHFSGPSVRRGGLADGPGYPP